MLRQTQRIARWPRFLCAGQSILAFIPLLAAALLIASCATVRPSIALDYTALAERAANGEMVDVGVLKQAFLDTSDFSQRFRQLALLEKQVLRMLDQEPLRLGAVGSAILDQYYGSLAGHQALVRFYSHLEADEQAAWHRAWVAAIRTALEATATSMTEQESQTAYAALSANEAEAFLIARDQTVVGARYEVSDERFVLWMWACREGQGVRPVLFDLTDLYTTIALSVARDRQTLLPIDREITCQDLDICTDFNPYTFLRALAFGGDSAAQTFIGWEMSRAGRLDDAGRWLERASASENAVANLILAEVFLLKALATQEDRDGWMAGAERYFQLAIGAGFDSAMVRLGIRYLLGDYGDEKVPAGESLLQRAADLDNVEAMLRLGGWYADGTVLHKDMTLSERYFLRAAELDDRAKVQYARFLTHPMVGRELTERAWQWLRDMAKNGDPEAMLLIGDLYARGEHVDLNFRRAKSWFRNLAKALPDDAYFVNEVAWRLTASHIAKLRDERYALKIMDRVMADEAAEARRNPAYLDTWAAAFAANGDFDRAITVQEKAIELARANGDPNGELDILNEHLDAFRARQVISDDNVP